MVSLWKFGGLSWIELGKRVWSEINDDDMWGRSAQLAYYFLLALFPLLPLSQSYFEIRDLISYYAKNSEQS